MFFDQMRKFFLVKFVILRQNVVKLRQIFGKKTGKNGKNLKKKGKICKNGDEIGQKKEICKTIDGGGTFLIARENWKYERRFDLNSHK